MLRKSLNLVSSLFKTPSFNFGGTRKKTKAQRAKYFESRPLYYKKVTKLKMPDFRSPNLEFPINIPVRNVYIFRPVKRRPLVPNHDFINFKMLSGNEILLYLENPTNLRISELCSALLELRKKRDADKIDWSSHEWINLAVDLIKKNCSTYNAHNISNLVTALHDLRIKDIEMWQLLSKCCFKMIFNSRGSSFGKIFDIYISNPEYSNSNFRNHLVIQLPRFLHKCSAKTFADVFVACHKGGLVSKYLLDNYFFVYIRERGYWLGVYQLPRCLEVLVALKYDYKDSAFWIERMLPICTKLVRKNLTEAGAPVFIASMERIASKVESYQIVVGHAKAKLHFMSTIWRSLRENQIHKQVLNDIRFYKELEEAKMDSDKV